MNTLRETAPQKTTAANALAPVDSPRRIQILLVDDDIYVCELNAGVLIRAGYDVDTAGDGTIAWKILHDRDYDLLITDNGMPRMTGLELIEKLHSEDWRLPIILATGTVPVEELKRHARRNLDATLIKPFTSAELLATVEKVLLATENARPSSELFREAALQDHPGRPGAAPVRALPPGPMSSPQRILVVDDDSSTRQVSVEVLVRSGYTVKAVQDGAEGWSALLSGSYDLVLTDNKMPRMTGVEMIEKLRAARMTLPVIMATSYLPVREFARRPWLQPDAMLERPFSSDELLQTVKKILGPDDGSDDRRESPISKYL